MKRVTILAAVICIVSARATSTAQEKKPEQKSSIAIERDVTFGKGGDIDLQLDLAMPKEGNGPFPAIVCIHGGGWIGGNRQSFMPMVEKLAEDGFVAVTITYRLSTKAKWPAQIEDCKAAVRWLRTNAKKYMIDPAHIGATGGSAGAHLACFLGTADKDAGLEGKGGHAQFSSRVQAVVSIFGPTDLTVPPWDKSLEKALLVPLLGGTLEEKPDIYKQFSPITYVTKDDPPFLFFHGDKDKIVPIEQSELLVKKLKQVGVHAELVTIKGAGHGFGKEAMVDVVERMSKFFKDKLKK